MYVLLTLLLLGTAAPLMGQSIPELEKKFRTLQEQLSSAQSSLDSLKTRLEAYATRIDEEKHKQHPNRNEIAALMSEGVLMTEQVNRQEMIVLSLQQESEHLRYRLANRYSAIIDSLQALENSPSFAGDRDRLRRQIILYAEKYLLFSPALKALSFNPREIQMIELDTARDSLELAIYRNYLQKAAADIDSHLVYIRKDRRELENAVRLEEKTREFLEEVDDASLGLIARSGVSSDVSGASAVLEGTTEERLVVLDPAADGTNISQELLSRQFESIFLFARQLDLEDAAQLRYFRSMSGDPQHNSLTMREYLSFLKEAQKRLEEYRLLILQKLDRTTRP